MFEAPDWDFDAPGTAPMQRYILMRYDPTGRNHAHLFSYADVVKTVVDTRDEEVAVDIVRIEYPCQDEDQIHYLALHQHRTLERGMEARSHLIFKTLGEAELEAAKVTKILAVKFRNRGVTK